MHSFRFCPLDKLTINPTMKIIIREYLQERKRKRMSHIYIPEDKSAEDLSNLFKNGILEFKDRFPHIL